MNVIEEVALFNFLHHNPNLILTGNCPETIKKQLLVHVNDNEKLNFAERLDEHYYSQAFSKCRCIIDHKK